MEAIELKISDMTCGSCAASVAKALKRIPGVEDVQVDLPRGTAQVSGQDVAQQIPALVAALSEAGYAASASSPAQPETAAQSSSCHSDMPADSRSGSGCCCR